MTRAVPVLYIAILAIFVAAGSLLTARTDPAETTAALPESCALVPTELANELFPGRAAESQTTIADTARFGRWLDPDGEVLIELRCARFRFADVGAFREAVDDAESGRTTLLGTDPEAILAEVPDGVIIRQLDEGSGLLRTWFVRAPLTTDEAVDVVTRTHAFQDQLAGEPA